MKPATIVRSVPAIDVNLKHLILNQTLSKMFKRHNVTLMSNPVCENKVDDLNVDDFLYYDKDGFELNVAEQKFYRAQDFPINHPLLNHICWQQPWFEIEDNDCGLLLDHSMFLCRAGYCGAALDQLEKLKKTIPYADLLTRTRVKWGYDFALDSVNNDTVFEVLHVEYDSIDYEHFVTHMIQFDWTVRHTDWKDAANKVWQHRDKWQNLKGFQQNRWKAEFLLGWKQAEYTEKASS
jgi:hypothetical protein